jgi:hypothetical protein
MPRQAGKNRNKTKRNLAKFKESPSAASGTAGPAMAPELPHIVLPDGRELARGCRRETVHWRLLA